jgi:hypothetical protein
MLHQYEFRGGLFGLDDACSHAFCLHAGEQEFDLWGYQFHDHEEARLKIPREFFPRDAVFLGPRQVQSCFGTVGMAAISAESGILTVAYSVWPWKETTKVQIQGCSWIDRFSMLPPLSGGGAEHPFCLWPTRFGPDLRQPVFCNLEGKMFVSSLPGDRKTRPWRGPFRDSPILASPRMFFQSRPPSKTRLIPFGGQEGVIYGSSGKEDRLNLGTCIGLSRFGIILPCKNSVGDIDRDLFEIVTPRAGGTLSFETRWVLQAHWEVRRKYDLGFLAQSNEGKFFGFAQKPDHKECVILS